MTSYVAGFLFDVECRDVLLIEKQKPDWQAGFLNAIGGKIEENEGAYEAMAREFFEETTYSEHLDWIHFCSLNGDGWDCRFFAQRIKAGDNLCYIKSREAEQVRVVADWQPRLWELKMIPNLRWLIPMAAGFVRGDVAINPGLQWYRIHEV